VYLTLTFHKLLTVEGQPDELQELGSYEYTNVVPWVPPQGSFFRFRDFRPPGKEIDHTETAGWIEDVTTCFYSANRITVEVVIRPRTK
jgi:hypothetical protein